ncbi:MAG: FG-GAP-like repeat-containing protein [Planctomycetota bacterium]|nr:FG-GAP-like repeat-containing protein [Planctomycetota bacterium]
MRVVNRQWRTVGQMIGAVLFGLMVVGCGSTQSEQDVDELLRRQRQREQQDLIKPKSIEQKIKEIQDYLQNGNRSLAEQMLRQLLISDPDDPHVLQLWAEYQASQGETLAALESLESIKSDDLEKMAELRWLAVDLLVDANEYAMAELKLQQLLQETKNVVRVHRKLASILNNQGRRIEAGQHLRELAKLGEIRERDLVAMTTLSSPFIDESLPKPDFGGRLNPAMLAQARLLHSQSDLAEAIFLVQQLRRAFPDSLPIAAFEGRLYGDAQDDEAMRNWIETAPAGIEIESEYWATLGVWLHRQDRHRDAVRCLAEAVRRDPTDRFSYDRLQRSLRFLGRDVEADLVAGRFQLLVETATLAKKFGQKRGSIEELNRMADLMLELHRPWESLGWRFVALTTYGGSEAEREKIKQTRQDLADSPSEDDVFSLCGLDLSQWPLPTDEVFGSIEVNSTEVRSDPGTGNFQFDLRDVATNVGLDFRYDNGDADPDDRSRLLHELTGGGIGVIDYDLDGWPDLYLTQGGGDAFESTGSKPNSLFRNLAGGHWTEVTSATETGDRGYGQGVEVADLNQDGFSDLLVANVGANLVYINNGDGTFRRQALGSPDTAARWTTSLACGDLNGDHLPEIVEVNYVDDPRVLVQRCTPEASGNCNPQLFNAAADRVWQVNANGEVNAWNGCKTIPSEPYYGFAAVIANFDKQTGNELFIANDAGPNHFWVGQEPSNTNGRVLVESARAYGCAVGHDGLARACMGVAFGDFDRNGMFDLQITNFWDEPSDIFLQRSTKLFVPASASMGMFLPSRETVGWGTVAVDLDRNGWLDFAVLNGHVREDPRLGQPFAMRPQLFRGGREGFTLLDGQTLVDRYWSETTVGRTMATLDWNGDRKPDLVTNHLDDPVALLENQGSGGRSIRVELVGTQSGRDAVGTIVTLVVGDERWVGWQTGGDGFLCSHEAVVDFGIGNLSAIDRIEVQWPSGLTQNFENLETDSQYLLVEGEVSVFRRSDHSSL